MCRASTAPERSSRAVATCIKPGDQVLVTGYELGAGHWGGYSAFVRVPAEWIVPLPTGLTLRESMIYGTAGFTAAQCVTAIVERGIRPERGRVVVTGATGGVGSLAVAILAKLGYEVTAVTGKPGEHSLLHRLGAAKIVGRKDVLDNSDRPLLAARWAAAVDTVGGQPLATIIRSMQHRGCVAACGLVAGTELPLTVYPFILRGVTLAGIDSAKCPRPQRLEMWQKLAGPWRVDQLDELAEMVTLDELPKRVQQILAGENRRPHTGCAAFDPSRASLTTGKLLAVFVERHRRRRGHVVTVRHAPHGDFDHVVELSRGCLR